MSLGQQPKRSEHISGAARLTLHLLLLTSIAAVLVVVYPRLAALAQSSSATPGHQMALSARGGAVPASVAGAVPLDLDIQATIVPTDVLPLGTYGSILKVPQPLTIIPKRPRKEVVTYNVAAGDNLSTISERFDVDVDTLIWANDKLEEDPDYLLVGQVLRVPPVSGVLYSAQNGDTIDAIAKKFKGDVRTMMELEFNNISSANSTPLSGTLLMVPGGEKAYQPRLVYINGVPVMVNAPRGGGRFMWPTQGYITSFFGDGGHGGIDIAGPLGTPVYASDAGVVVFAGWYGNYGNAVIIDHGSGYQTVYGHFMTYYPQVGQNVRRGQAIGKMGSTGRSTGSHLHFEILYGGGFVNPLRYLPQ